MSFHLCLLSLLSSFSMPTKFKGSVESWFVGSEKDFYFYKIPKSQHKLVREYK